MKKFALLVGVNNYKNIDGLMGCVNDITNVRNILKTFFGFSNDDIRVLADERATKANILSRLEKMVDTAKKGDHLVFHFSGHGSQIRDRDNDELNDHMDELICPYDMNWDNGYITDDMLRVILDRLTPGVRMEIILDSCHSGTGTRELDADQTLGRFLRPPVDIECRFQGEEEKLSAPRQFRTDPVIVMNHILWAACRDNQTSADAYIDGRYNGAFTYYFCKHLRENRGNISREQLHTLTADSLSHHNFTQSPQLECNNNLRSGKIFS
jgi:metacaspase-1